MIHRVLMLFSVAFHRVASLQTRILMHFDKLAVGILGPEILSLKIASGKYCPHHKDDLTNYFQVPSC